MLASFRKMAGGLVAKLLLGFLVLTFALWGVGDMFQGGSGKVLATIGGHSITESDLASVIDNLQRNYPEITAEMASDPTFRTEALNSLVNREIMRLQAKELGLDFSSDALAGYIGQNENFRDKDGNFDRNRFVETLRQNGLSERAFLSRFAQDLSSSLIEDSIAVGWVPSEAMLGLYHYLRNEKRDATLILLSAKDAGKPKEPSADDIKKIYAAEQARFAVPESRSFSYASFDAKIAVKALGIEATDDVLKPLYEEHKDSFTQPEKRDVEQLLFADEADARKAHESLKDADDWKKASKLASVQNKDSISLGRVGKTDLPDEAAEAVFALKEGAFSEPVQTGFGWHIFYVAAIAPADVLSYEKAKEQLAQDYIAQQSEEGLSKLANTLEDAIAGGATMEEALKTNGIEAKPQSLGPLSADGRNADGKQQELSALQMEALTQAFTLDAGETSGVNLAPDESYYIVQVQEIIPESVKPLEDVQDQLAELFRQRATQMALQARASEVAEKLKEAENPTEAARDMGLSLHRSGPLTRTQETIEGDSQLKGKNLTSGFVMELFRLRPPEATAPYPLPGGDFVIGILDTIDAPKPATEEELAALEKEMTATMAQEAMYLYLSYLREHYELEVRTDLLYGTTDSGNQAP